MEIFVISKKELLQLTFLGRNCLKQHKEKSMKLSLKLPSYLELDAFVLHGVQILQLDSYPGLFFLQVRGLPTVYVSLSEMPSSSRALTGVI